MFDCRVCFETFSERDKVLSPCKCSGTQGYICRDCFEIQRDIMSETKCPTCKFVYEYERDGRVRENVIKQHNVDHWFSLFIYFLVLMLFIALVMTKYGYIFALITFATFGLLLLTYLGFERVALILPIVVLIIEDKSKKNREKTKLFGTCLMIIFMLFIFGVCISNKHDESRKFVANIDENIPTPHFRELKIKDQELQRFTY